ncbi:MAG: Gfo/Idh/MocA family oxidoreductase, partial [Candidatus Nanoarchaeia archaeon]
LIEKPFTKKSEEALELINLAKEKNLICGVGHTFLYSGAVEKMKELVEKQEIGEVLHINSSRLNLGRFQNGTNVVWDLAPHDLSIILHILGEEMPIKVIASGQSHYNLKVEDTANISLTFRNNVSAHLNLSWINPDKVRTFTVIGTKKMIMFDDVEVNEKIKIYDQGVAAEYTNYGEFFAAYRYGDISIPKIGGHEALGKEVAHFLECIKTGKKLLTDAESGYKIVKLINCIEEAMKSGKAVLIEETS